MKRNQSNNLLLTCLTIAIGLLSFACSNQNQSLESKEIKKQFSCEKSTAKTAQETWTVMYKKTATEIKPWLNLTKTNIESDNLEKTCNEIAKNLDQLTQQGLFQINYHIAPQDQNKYLLCGKTKNKPNECAVIIPFKETKNIDKAFQEITQPLQEVSNNNKQPTYQKEQGGTSITYSAQETTNVINLTSHLTSVNLEQNPK